MLNDKIKRKITIKQIRMKTEIKKIIRGQVNIFVWRVRLERKINLTKRPRKKKLGSNWRKTTHHKLWLKYEI
jgi:hypothetical protein